MAKRATELIGKSVVSANTGERLGTVSDLLLDDAGSGVVGFVLRHGLMKPEDVLPADAVQTLGTDVIVSRTGHLIGAEEWHDRQREHEQEPAQHQNEARPAEPR
jgi:uncharacterized protein YrrD